MEISIDLSVIQRIRVNVSYKRCSVFFAWLVTMFHLFLHCTVNCSRVPIYSWRKHEWSCCQRGTEVFAVAAISAGHMSKGFIWINGFSRDWWAQTEWCKGTVCCLFSKVNQVIDFGKHQWSCFCQTWPLVSLWRVLSDVKILQCAKTFANSSYTQNLLHESPGPGCTLTLCQI